MPKPRTIIKGRTTRPMRWNRGPLAAARMKLYRRPRFNSTPTFTETYRLRSLISNGTGTLADLLTVRFQDIAQYAQYAALYNQYCIRSAQFILVPAYDQYGSTTDPVGPSAVSIPRLVYAINDSAQQVVPTNELDVLTDNGCKIRMLDRPIKIRCRPVAQVGMSSAVGGFVSETKKSRWLSTVTVDTPHLGVSFCISQLVQGQNLSDLPPICTVYVKLTFSLRDPK